MNTPIQRIGFASIFRNVVATKPKLSTLQCLDEAERRIAVAHQAMRLRRFRATRK